MVESAITNLQRVSQALKVDSTAAVVMDALSADHIPAILLKGSTLDFLYADEQPRSYVDVDVLVPIESIPQAAGTLGQLGYRDLHEGYKNDEKPSHASTWVRDGHPAVDLHHTISGATADSPIVWELLSRQTRPHRVGGADTVALDEIGCAMHVATHTARAGNDTTDLARAVRSLRQETWAAAARLAVAIGAADAFRAGLRCTPEGVQLAHDLGVPAAEGLRWHVDRHGPRGSQLLAEFVETRGARDRVHLLGRMVYPSTAMLRLASPLARRGRAGLLASRVARPFVLAFRLVPAIRTLISARRRGH